MAAGAIFAPLFFTACLAAQEPKPASINPSTMARIGAVDERFQSYNIEMVEVTGGRFWKPYDSQVDAILASQAAAKESGANQPVGMNPALYQYRPPIDLSNARLRKLAAALGPAYLRVSGTWQNSTYFQDSDDPAPQTPPKGFGGVLTRRQWKGVINFSHAADAKIITSFATSVGTRDAAGVWTPDQASQFLAYTKSIGGGIAAAEYMNEPTFASMGGAPKGYDAAAYARDIAVFLPFIRKAAPDMVVLGPGSVGEGIPLAPGPMQLITTESIMSATGPVFDAFSYHFYGTISQRCAAALGPNGGTTPEAALSNEWLSRTDTVEAFYAGLRDRFLPGKAMWLTETGQAACGGDKWASTFIDSFRYLNQLGTLSQRGVQVVAHNTLAASDYGLIDEKTLTPRPNYWAALLWRKLMGTTVLNPGDSPSPQLKLYAHCLRNAPGSNNPRSNNSGAVALLVINTDRRAPLSLNLPAAATRYTLSAPDLLQSSVELNGRELKLGADDSLPQLTGTPTQAGNLTFAPASITFLALPKANNAACR
jgi:heparanase